MVCDGSFVGTGSRGMVLSSVVALQCPSVVGEGMDGVEVVGCQDHSPPSVGSLCDHGHGSSGDVGWQMVGP